MKENSRKVLNRIKRNLIERESEIISQGLNSVTPAVVVTTLNELRRLKDPFHMHDGVRLLDHSSDEVVIAALRYLERVEHPLESEKMKSLLTRSVKVKKEVAKAAELCDYKSACEILRTLLQEPSSDVKIAVLSACSNIGCDDAVEEIKEMSNSDDIDLKMAALEALIELGEEVEEEKLKKVIFDTSLPDKNRKMALKVFLKNSISPFETIKKVIALDHLPLSSIALEFLGNMKCESVWEIMEEMLDKENLPAKVIPILKASLKNCAEENTKLEKFALNHLKHPSKKVKVLAFKILMQMDVPQASDIVEDFLNSSSADLRSVAIPFIYHYPTEENVETLKEILHKGDEKSVIEALKVIRKLKIRSDEIEKYMNKNYPLTVRKEALKALISLGTIEANELESIALSNDSLELRMIALDGLAKIDPDRLTELEVA